VPRGAASGHLGWVRRAAAHPQVAAALAEGHILSESVARKICQWTDKLPEDCRLAADAILIVAAKSGADLRSLAELAAEIYARSLPDDPDEGPDDGFDDRAVACDASVTPVVTADVNPVALDECILFCWHHHQVVIHRMGWTVVLNPDGTTTAWNREKTKILHSHSPPAQAG
jgi:hypothetical protein